ncbi:MAG: hypothetical protein AVDCRST_MAG19-2171 [uncultured Thermomicrobiales bacterium]|uniref:Uncharacterized protein n=1 Tax=uncultured Thermomicrobiales bacterium TaxID=1645740 RepID=A0A6J4V487_9BACT|nr:MAG: hypothetical protein AVDCRST_MAG19-2171 [uncultured Thermomicrobiales bacterium]
MWNRLTVRGRAPRRADVTFCQGAAGAVFCPCDRCPLGDCRSATTTRDYWPDHRAGEGARAALLRPTPTCRAARSILARGAASRGGIYG